MAAAPARSQQYDQLTAHAPSMFRTFTATEDGKTVYTAEGASIVVLEPFTNAGVPSPGKLALENGKKRFPVGETCVVPADLMLDPDAASPPGSGSEDLLYVAGGRQGLWVVEADPDPAQASNGAWRVDDSGDLNPGTQNSRRWCCDLDVVRIQGEDVLLALFAKRNGSRLRGYLLDDVRALKGATGETGNELVPLLDVDLGKHPNVSDAGVPQLFGRGVSISMDSVNHDYLSGEETADVYIAMGHHGLLRVTVTGGYHVITGEFGLDGSKTWGPVLGDGTSYHTTSAEYGNFRFVIDSSVPEFSWWDQPDLLQRQERPFFADVAVDWRGSKHHLYCAVDHLSWMRFDLDDPWGPTMPIDLHEMDRNPATWPTAPGGQVLGSAIEAGTLLATGAPAKRPAFARKLHIQPVQVDQDTTEVWMAVTFNDRPIVKDLAEARIEGVPYQHDLQYGGGGVGFNATDRTLLYPLHNLGGPFPRYRAGLDHGGHRVQILLDQPLLASDQKLRLLHSYKLGSAAPNGKKGLGICLSQVNLHLPAFQTTPTFGIADTFPRSISHSSGRMVFNLAPSPVDPRLLVAGTNDASLPIDGWLYTDDSNNDYELERHYSPAGGTAGYLEFPSGHKFEIGGLWRESPTSDTFVSWNEGNIHTAVAGSLRWTYSRVQIPNSDAVANAPQVLQRWRFDAPEDEFGNSGREYYYWGYRSTYFEQQTGAKSLMFANRSRSPQGVVMIDTEAFEDWIINDGANRHDLGTHPNLTDADSNQWNSTQLPEVWLTTHPEFNGMPTTTSTLGYPIKAWWRDVNKVTESGQDYFNPGLDDPVNNVLTWPPEVIPVRASATSTTLDGWVLAVPCAFLSADPDWDAFDDNLQAQGASSNYLPSVGSPMRDFLHHALWQFWPVEIDVASNMMEVRQVTGGGLTGNSSLPKYIYDPAGSEPAPGHAWEVEWILGAEDPEVAGDEQVYAFLLDFVGRLHVLRIEDILQQENLVGGIPGYTENLLTELETWETPQGLLDLYGNNCFDIALELEHGEALAAGASTRIFLAVRRVGVVVLEFDPTATPMLTELETIQTGEYTHGVEIQRLPGGETRLLVSDYGGGIRVFDI